MTSFTEPLIGGMLIGLGSVLAMAGSGKVPGISGIAARVLRQNPGDTAWRVVFLLALVLGAGIASHFSLGWTGFSLPGYRPLGIFALAGLLVGFGTRMGGGCTSGHGVCGIGSGARDGFIYTVVFMIAAIMTVFAWKYVAEGGAL